MDDEKWITLETPKPIRVKPEVFKEWLSGIFAQNCYVCQNFSHGLGGSGFCKKSTGCLARDMMDVFDTCDCDSFEPIMPWEMGRM